MSNRKDWLNNPTFYFVLTVILYGIFEILNATVVCQTTRTTIFTGLTSFLGFWTMVATIILLVQQYRQTRRFSWLWVALGLLIIALFIFDAYLGKTCFYN